MEIPHMFFRGKGAEGLKLISFWSQDPAFSPLFFSARKLILLLWKGIYTSLGQWGCWIRTRTEIFLVIQPSTITGTSVISADPQLRWVGEPAGLQRIISVASDVCTNEMKIEPSFCWQDQFGWQWNMDYVTKNGSHWGKSYNHLYHLVI